MNKRDFLKASILGVGATAIGPNLMANSKNKMQENFPKRFIFIRKSNGIMPHLYTPPTFSKELKQKELHDRKIKPTPFEVDLDKHELPAWLQSLDKHKENMTILQGLSCRMCEIGHGSHQSIMAAINSKVEKISTFTRASVDYELAKLFPSPQGHVELSFANNRSGIVPGWSIPAPYTKNFCYADPITAYKNLFKSVINPSLVEKENSMLEFLKNDQTLKNNKVKGHLKNGYENYISSIQSVQGRNKELIKLAPEMKQFMPDEKMIYKLGNPTGNLIDRQNAMTEVLISALITGMTNVITYTIDNLDTTYSGLPELENQIVKLHRVGHGEGYGGKSPNQVRELVRRQHIAQVKKIVERLKAQPEGKGTMFDNTMIMYFPEAGEGHHGNGIKPPFLILSGKNCNLDIAGRYIRLPHHLEEGHKTLGNWYTTLLNAHGNNIKHYGDLDVGMRAKKLNQFGPIKPFLKKV